MTRPPTNAQTRPPSRPTATVQTTAENEDEVRLGAADPKIWPDGEFKQAATVAPTAARQAHGGRSSATAQGRAPGYVLRVPDDRAAA